MRVMISVLLLASAALAALPSASATSELPVGCNADVGVCVWQDTPNGDCAGVHFGMQGAGACADTDPLSVRACTSVRSALWDGYCPTDAVALSLGAALPAPPIPSDPLDLIVCNPDFAGVCYHTSPTGACAGVNFGLQGAGACADRKAGVRVCTSARSVLWDGFCPTDGTVLDEIIALD